MKILVLVLSIMAFLSTSTFAAETCTVEIMMERTPSQQFVLCYPKSTEAEAKALVSSSATWMTEVTSNFEESNFILRATMQTGNRYILTFVRK